jgi:hypothetical protein
MSHVGDELGIALEQHLGGSVAHLLGDPLGMFAGRMRRHNVVKPLGRPPGRGTRIRW